jgi:hypothetical protein
VRISAFIVIGGKVMKILRKEGQKDYYDYLMGVLGQDELVVYDRREAFPIDPTKKWGCEWNKQYPSRCSDYQNINIERWFRKEPIYGDEKRKTIKRWNSYKVLDVREQNKETDGMSCGKRNRREKEWKDIQEGQIFHFVLEVGYHHYYFEVERYLDDEDESRVHLDYRLVDKQEIERDDKISYAPMCLAPVHYKKWHWYGGGDNFEWGKEAREQMINNPILYSTYIPKFIDAYEIWNNLYEYISSLRDKEFTDTRTNDQHIESHGFDKKISFRHRK